MLQRGIVASAVLIAYSGFVVWVLAAEGGPPVALRAVLGALAVFPVAVLWYGITFLPEDHRRIGRALAVFAIAGFVVAAAASFLLIVLRALTE